MKYCTHCGNEINEHASVCIKCGCLVNSAISKPQSKEEDKPSTGYAILGFFIPLAGLVLWLVWKDEYPLRAKSAGKGALINLVVNFGLFLLYIIVVIIVVIVSSIASGQGLISSF